MTESAFLLARSGWLNKLGSTRPLPPLNMTLCKGIVRCAGLEGNECLQLASEI